MVLHQSARAASGPVVPVTIDSQHIPEPQIFAHTLMHHLFVYAAASRVAQAWTHGEIGVLKFTPDAHHFDPFSLIRFNEEFITHGDNPPAAASAWIPTPEKNCVSFPLSG